MSARARFSKWRARKLLREGRIPAGVYLRGWVLSGETVRKVLDAGQAYGRVTVRGELDRLGRAMVVISNDSVFSGGESAERD
jgi:hypothetical protein